jgi:hypothetical protein
MYVGKKIATCCKQSGNAPTKCYSTLVTFVSLVCRMSKCWYIVRGHLGLAVWCGVSHCVEDRVATSRCLFLVSSVRRWNGVFLTFIPYPFFFICTCSSVYCRTKLINHLTQYMYVCWFLRFRVPFGSIYGKKNWHMLQTIWKCTYKMLFNPCYICKFGM